MAMSANRKGNESGNRKYQSNAPVKWSELFVRAGKHIARANGTGEGEGVYLALAYAVEHSDKFVPWAKAQGHGLKGGAGGASVVRGEGRAELVKRKGKSERKPNRAKGKGKVAAPAPAAGAS